MIALERNESFSRFHSARAGVNQWQTDWIIELHKNWRKGNAYTTILTVDDRRIIAFEYIQVSSTVTQYCLLPLPQAYRKVVALLFSELYISPLKQ